MSDQQIAKLIHKGLSRQTATKLIDAGLYTPKLIKAASDEQLLAISGVVSKDVTGIRASVG